MELTQDKKPGRSYCVPSLQIVGENDLGNTVLRDYIIDHLECECSIGMTADTHAASKMAPMVYLMDYRNLNGFDAHPHCRKCTRRKPNSFCALYNVHRDDRIDDYLSCSHLRGMFFSDAHPIELIRGIKGMLEGEHWIPREVLAKALARLPPGESHAANYLDTKKITGRERQVLNMLESGATNVEIARKLSLSEHTIKTHLYNVFRKLGVRNRVEAINLIHAGASDTIKAP